MQTKAWHRTIDEAGTAQPATITTTLYDLIAACSAAIEPGEEELITATVMYLCNSGRLKFTGDHRDWQVMCS